MSPYGQEDGEALPTGSNVTVIRERRDDLCDIYKAASVYVFPTFNDEGVIGTPLSIFEALANGTPVVARRSAATARWADLPGLTLVDSDIELVEAAQHHHERVASLASINAHTCTGDLAVCQ
jgi:glycosyltransferase involved in cell wall biosynthesis